jgi:hypothetical protein
MGVIGAIGGMLKRRSTQVVGTALAVGAMAFGAGVMYERGKVRTVNMPLNDDQLERIESGNVLGFEGEGVNVITYRYNPMTNEEEVYIEDEDEEEC